MVTLYYKISQPLLSTLAIFEWIWINSHRIDGADRLEGNRLVRKSEKRFFYFFTFVAISKKHISPDWLNRFNHNFAVLLYDIRYTFTDFCSTIYDGFRVPWHLHIIIIIISVLKRARRETAINDPYNHQQFNAVYEACKRKSKCPSGQAYNYPIIRPDSSRQRCRRFLTFLCTRKAKKWKHRISQQSSQTCALLLAYLLWTPAECAETEGPNKFLHLYPNITDLNCDGLVFSGLLASCPLVLNAFFLVRVSTVIKCWLKWQYARTTKLRQKGASDAYSKLAD